MTDRERRVLRAKEAMSKDGYLALDGALRYLLRVYKCSRDDPFAATPERDAMEIIRSLITIQLLT